MVTHLGGSGVWVRGVVWMGVEGVWWWCVISGSSAEALEGGVWAESGCAIGGSAGKSLWHVWARPWSCSVPHLGAPAQWWQHTGHTSGPVWCVGEGCGVEGCGGDVVVVCDLWELC